MTPLRIFGFHKVTIAEVKKTEWKGTESLTLVFQDAEGRAIDGRFKKPFSEISKNQIKSLMKVTNSAAISDLKGKECVISVAPSDYNGKTYWNPSRFMDVKYAKWIGKDGNSVDDFEDIFEDDSKEPKVDDEELPF